MKKFVKFCFVGVVWSVILFSVFDFILQIIWNFSLFSLSDWKLLNTFWNTGGAIRSFAESGDPRFYSVFKDDFDSANKDLRRSAIFAARFICWGNKEAVEKLMALAKDADKDIAAIATDVLVEMKGQMVDVLLWDNPDFSKVMILRGSKDHLEALWNRFFTDEGIKDREVSQMVEQTLMWHNLRAFVEKMNSFAKEEYRMAAAKIITKKLALLRDKDNMQRIANEALQGVVRADDEVAKFISSKLKISLDKLG